jgi:pimeloyl-ACP methyl ester carboxylesterase
VTATATAPAPATGTLPVIGRSFILRTDDGVDLAARLLPADEPTGVAAVLVHGFAASQDDPKVVAVAEALRGAGLHVVTYDSRGHGVSGGLCTLGDRERHDVAAAVAMARDHADEVVLVGASMGAIAVLRHAAVDPSVAGVVTVSSPSRWRFPRTARALLALVMTQTPLGRWVAAKYLGVRLAPDAMRGPRPETPEALTRRVQSPLAIVHGRLDRFVLARDAAELHAGATGRCRLDLVDGMGHAFDALGVPTILAAVEWARHGGGEAVADVAALAAVQAEGELAVV